MRAAPLRRLGLVLAGTALVLVGAGLGAPLAAPPAAAAPRAPSCVTPEGEVATDQVLVVVVFPSGPATACTAPGGSGIDVLRRAGFSVTDSGYATEGGAAAVCALGPPGGGEQVGCQTGPSCLRCQAPDYWVYSPCYRYSQVGGGSTRPEGGTVEGWRWSSGRAWDAAFPAACDSDGDDVVDAPPPTSPPTRPPGDGGGGGGGAHGGPGQTTPRDPAAPGTPTTTTTTRPGDTTTSSTSTTRPGETTTTTTSSTTTPAGGERAAEERAAGAAPGGTVSITDGGDGGGGAVVPLAGTGAIVAALGAVALRVRRHRRAEVA